jgi:hypothetical protein
VLGGLLEEILKILGLGTPFIYAMAAYGLFHFLEEKASDEAKAALTGWLRPETFKKESVAIAISEIFDRIYHAPLLSWNSFFRSAVISTAVTALFWIEMQITERRAFDLNIPFIWLSLFTIIISDYCSLFFLRKWVSVQWKSPIRALINGALIAGGIVTAFFLVRYVVYLAALEAYLAWDLPIDLARKVMTVEHALWVDISYVVANPLGSNSFRETLIAPALAVHIWLLLLAFGITVLKLAHTFAWSIEKMEWFLKDGKLHPLEAVGYVAAGATFVVSTTIVVLGHFLS